jgi:flagellar hook-associated protein 2
MNVTVDGQSKLITFSNKTYDSVESVRAELASQIGAAFGSNYIAVTADSSSVTLSYDGGTIAISDSGISGSEASGVLSFTSGQSNRISLNKMISETSLLRPCGSTINFTVNGQNFSFTGDNTIQQIMNKINSSNAGVKISYSSVSDKFTLTSTNTGTGNSITCTDTDGGFLSSILNGGNFTDGTNAVLQITSASGTQTITRRSNSFSIDGLNITLLGKADGDAAENITLTTSNNIDAVVDRIKTFVTDYNDMIKSVNTELTEERYRDYAPLTDD